MLPKIPLMVFIMARGRLSPRELQTQRTAMRQADWQEPSAQESREGAWPRRNSWKVGSSVPSVACSHHDSPGGEQQCPLGPARSWSVESMPGAPRWTARPSHRACGDPDGLLGPSYRDQRLTPISLLS